MKVTWVPNAANELERVLGWLWDRNPRAAVALTERLQKAMERLETFPHSGRWVPEVATETYRELLVAPLRIIYRAEGDGLLIVHVLRQEEQLDPNQLN